MTIIKPRIPANADTMSRDELEELLRFNAVQVQRDKNRSRPFFWIGQFLLIPTLLFSWFGPTPQSLVALAGQLTCLTIYTFFATRSIRGLRSNIALLDILIKRCEDEITNIKA